MDDYSLRSSHSRPAATSHRPTHRYSTYEHNETETVPNYHRQPQVAITNKDRDYRLIPSIEGPATSSEPRNQVSQRRIRSPDFNSKTYHIPPGELDYDSNRSHPSHKRTKFIPPSYDGTQDELNQMSALRLAERPVDFHEDRSYPHKQGRAIVHIPDQIPYQPDHYSLVGHRNPNRVDPELGRESILRPQPISSLDGNHFPPNQPRLANHEPPPRVRSLKLVQSPSPSNIRPVIGEPNQTSKPKYTYPSARFEPVERGIHKAWNPYSYPVEPRSPISSSRAHVSNPDSRMAKRYSDDFVRPIHLQGSDTAKHYDPDYMTQVRRPMGPSDPQRMLVDRSQGVSKPYGEPVSISPYQPHQSRIQYLDSPPRASQVPPFPHRRPVTYVSGAQREPILHNDWR